MAAQVASPLQRLQPVDTSNFDDFVLDAANAGTLKSKDCTLLIVGSHVPAKVFSSIIGSSYNFYGIYMFESKSYQKSAENLYELLGLQDWQIYETIQSISCLRYSRVRFISTKDLDSMKHLFEEQWEELAMEEIAHHDFGPNFDESFLGVVEF